MLYTVKEVSAVSHVTVKTLHHYHKLGLLVPSKISEAGYRLYGTKELERLQHILFYRELEFPLEQIKELLEKEDDRLALLLRQEELLQQRKQRLEGVIATLRHSVTSIREGKPMNDREMFKGFETEEAWNEALKEHNQHLEETYGIEPPQVDEGGVPGMNEQAAEAAAFMKEMADSLKAGMRHDHEQLQQAMRAHLAFMNSHGHAVSAADFAAQTRFFLSDDFHRQMLEGQQTGLAYYLCAAAEALAAGE